MRNATGKGNDAKKVMTFYRINFGIQPAYKVLLDAPFAHLCVERGIALREALTKLLGATAYPIATSCALKELKALGEAFRKTTSFVRQASQLPCAHGPSQESASACLAASMGNQSTLKFVLATNDPDLIKSALEQGNIPVITIGNQTRLVLRKPADATIERVRNGHSQKTDAPKRSGKVPTSETDTSNVSLKPRKTIVRKRKKAKGPNPLSVKKGKKRIAKGVSEELRKAEVVAVEPVAVKKKGRSRRRRKNNADVNTVPIPE